MALRLLLALFLCTTLARMAPAQVLQGDWVRKSDEAIELHRKGNLRIIVLDAEGLHVPDAKVHIAQESHAFTLGVVLPPDGITADTWNKPVWRVLNAAALDKLTAWPAVQPHANEAPRREAVAAAIDAARAHTMRLRWGGVVSADPGFVPDWLVPRAGRALDESIRDHVRFAVFDHRDLVHEFDLYADIPDHAFLEEKLGPTAPTRLFDVANALNPQATLCARFVDALSVARTQLVAKQVVAMQQAGAPLDAIAIEQQFLGMLVQQNIARPLAQLRVLDLPVVLASLEVGGPSASAASVNLETVLRTVFAEPCVTGIYFSGMTPETVAEPTAALLDAQGDPTDSGRLLEEFFRKIWWTDETATADELGNVRTRVFAGVYRITATLPDGVTITSTVRVEPSAPDTTPPTLILQPLKGN